MSAPAFTPGPWTACGNGACPCKQVWSADADYPVVTVNSGKWGDKFPAIRLCEDPGTIGGKAEAYMEEIVYGEIPEDTAKANAVLIAAAPELYEALSKVVADYELLLGDGITSASAPLQLVKARAALAKAVRP